ncbi:MAG: hypothetical protein HYS04_00455 [Acidobacteria bacterium]|nr:hypothetical protein [Acidobacteriota bacterium]
MFATREDVVIRFGAAVRWARSLSFTSAATTSRQRGSFNSTPRQGVPAANTAACYATIHAGFLQWRETGAVSPPA